jgi:hypothetical protein
MNYYVDNFTNALSIIFFILKIISYLIILFYFLYLFKYSKIYSQNQ